jgi:hypothetical protein
MVEAPDQELKRLRRENAELQKEREFAKKVAVYFAVEAAARDVGEASAGEDWCFQLNRDMVQPSTASLGSWAISAPSSTKSSLQQRRNQDSTSVHESGASPLLRDPEELEVLQSVVIGANGTECLPRDGSTEYLLSG